MRIILFLLLCNVCVAQELVVGSIYTWNRNNEDQSSIIARNGLNAEIVVYKNAMGLSIGTQNIGGLAALKIGVRGDMSKNCDCKPKRMWVTTGMDLHYYLQGQEAMFGAGILMNLNVKLHKNVLLSPVATMGFNTRNFFYGIGGNFRFRFGEL